MRVSWATGQGSPQRRNEDFVAAAPGAVVLLDGCGLALGTEQGCVHGTAWYARSLGTRLLARLLDGPDGTPPADPPVGPPEGRYVPGDRPLVNRLAGAIADVAAAHRGSCDLRHPATPAATVVALRIRGEVADYLVLADSTLLLHTTGRLAAVTTPVTRFYAAADPAVAAHALTGSVPLRDLRRVLLLSDGATRLVDMFRVLDWRELVRLVERDGPAALIERTRAMERSDPGGERWPRGKIHDDATVAFCDFTGATTGTSTSP